MRDFDRHAVRPADPDFKRLPRTELLALAAAGAEALQIERILARSDDNVVAELLRGDSAFYEWDHYPVGDVYDAESGAQFYYHAHEIKERFDAEHGHFHAFLRLKSDKGRPDLLSHLVAISMTAEGRAFRLFTVNRWVTDENLQPAATLVPLLDSFRIELARPSFATNRWLTQMVRFYRPQIVALLKARDTVLAAWRRSHPRGEAGEDRALQVLAYVDIDLAADLRRLEALLSGRPPNKRADPIAKKGASGYKPPAR